MYRLPNEVIEKILLNQCLYFEDVANFSSTCRRYRSLVSNSKFWKKKLQKKYPKLAYFLNSTERDVLKTVLFLYNLRRKIISLLRPSVRRDLYDFPFLLDFLFVKGWEDTPGINKKQLYLCSLNVLEEITYNRQRIETMDVVPFDTVGNLSLVYRAKRHLVMTKKRYLRESIGDFLKLPPTKRLLEQVSSFIAQWFQMHVDGADIETPLDEIADIIKRKLFRRNPQHGIFTTTTNLHNLEDNLWKLEECFQVWDVMCEVMFHDLGFTVDPTLSTANFFINEVLEKKTGSPLILAIIFESVGRRVGMVFKPVKIHSKCLLLAFIYKHSNSYYVDIFNKCARSTNLPHPFDGTSPQSPIHSVLQVFRHMLNCLGEVDQNGTLAASLKEFPRLQILPRQIHRNDYLPEIPISRSKLSKEMRLSSPFWFLVDICDQIFGVVRPNVVKYAVGMPVLNRINKKSCVIYGWTLVEEHRLCPLPEIIICILSLISSHLESYIFLLFSIFYLYQILSPYCYRNLTPKYCVLTEDGRELWAPQDQLEPTTNVGNLLSQDKLGLYFSHYHNNHFVPNEVVEKYYPYDGKIRRHYYRNNKFLK